MADFAAGYENWGLQAIVEGSTNFSLENNHQQYYYNNYSNDDHHNLRLAFSELFGHQSNSSSMVMDSDGLEEFYKPFYPISDSISAIDDHKQVQKKIETDQELVEVVKQNQNHTYQSATIEATDDDATKCKKSRKNQRKRVVVQVTADDFSSDKWAWRKYGQKPIKGSKYPRSYYKCSSMKACLARKQVEQSCSDPSKYIITYTAEHCHTHPTRRNSLAGTVRNRFPTPTIHPKSSSNNDDVTISSPKSSLMESCEDISDGKVKQERLYEDDHEEQRVVEWGFNKDIFCISDIVMNDEFFAALDDFDGSVLEESAIGMQ